MAHFELGFSVYIGLIVLVRLLSLTNESCLASLGGMASSQLHVLETKDLDVDTVEAIFHSADQDVLFNSPSLHKAVVILAFFEPSTRTRMSFELAALKRGDSVLRIDSIVNSSVAKGETLFDTLKNLEAMGPDLIVLRASEEHGNFEMLRQFNCSFISGGLGVFSHPTQALLDAYTIRKELGTVRDQRVLFLGDVEHSRVANSNLELLTRLGAQVAYCSPEKWKPTSESWRSVKSFSHLEEGLEWASVVMGLRIQFERHKESERFDRDEYHKTYGLNMERLRRFSPEGIVMHPGPIVFGCEFDRSVMMDPRTKVYKQVQNGVRVRRALIDYVLGALT